MKLGVIADLHGSLRDAKKLATYFKKADVDAIVLAGDVPSNKKQKQNMIKILGYFVKTRKKIFIMPGGHESYTAYHSALKRFKTYKNIIDCAKVFRHKLNGYTLLFVPGSDSSAPGAGFRLLRDKKQLSKFRKYVREYKEHFFGKIIPIYISDINRLANKNCIIISHVPPKFRKPTAIDVAEFGVPKRAFLLRARHQKLSKATVARLAKPNNAVFPLKKAKNLIKAGYPVKLKKANVGNRWLKKLIRKNKITKVICGHIHESGGRATNSKGEPIRANKWSKELFFNCASGEKGFAGLIEFKNNFVKYRRVQV